MRSGSSKSGTDINFSITCCLPTWYSPSQVSGTEKWRTNYGCMNHANAETVGIAKTVIHACIIHTSLLCIFFNSIFNLWGDNGRIGSDVLEKLYQYIGMIKFWCGGPRPSCDFFVVHVATVLLDERYRKQDEVHHTLVFITSSWRFCFSLRNLNWNNFFLKSMHNNYL